MGAPDASDSRLAALTHWVLADLGMTGARIETASADASFRRYFRVIHGGDSYIVMDAPPDKEDVAPFVRVARLLAGMDLNVPIVLARHEAAGFLLLSDLGTRHYLDELDAADGARTGGASAGRASAGHASAGRVDTLYSDALGALVTLQTAPRDGESLPPYDHALLWREMELLPEWFLVRHLKLPLGAAEREMLDRTFETLAAAALAQPVTPVHRDYHSRNLLVTPQNNPGIIDFQDAVMGPVTYDAVSLLKDCYVSWPRERVLGWLAGYRTRLAHAGLELGTDEPGFVRWFDLMGLQRHLKVLGIFARLHYRDGKPRYLKDLPRVLDYVRAAAATYPETAQFAAFVATRIDPAFSEAQAREGA